jgi:crotonobetainyl-CoA:carnitine CoA-transferase CaiB-like acyl-CoA transferase
MDYPLTGLKVLDFSRVLSGPFAGRILSDLGADVVKVEPPEGDVTRYWGQVIGGIPGYYNQQNAGKRNICMDLRAPGAVELVDDLVKQADILIENYRPDVMPRLGLGYDDLKKFNPQLIMLSISGFGAGGSEARRPAYAPVIHAEAGLISRQTTRTGNYYNDYPISLADTNASLHGLVGLLSAVILRDRTGVGQHIDMAMIDATVASDDQLVSDIDGSHATGPLPNDIWETPIGPILLSTDFRFLWRSITTECGVPDPTNKDMALEQKIALRRKATAEFMMTLDTREKVTELFEQFNIPWGDVREGAMIRDQTTLRERGSIIDIDDRDGGTRPVMQSPYRFSNASSGIRGPAPHQGEHNQEVLVEWLGRSVTDVDQLRSQGVLLTDEQRES